MKQKKTIPITMLTTAQHLESIVDAARSIEKDYGPIIRCSVHPVYRIENGLFDEARLRADLAEAEIVLIDVRSLGKTSKILHEEIDGRDKTVVSLVGSTKELLDFTQMGSFKASVIPAAEFDFDESFKDMTKVFKIQRLTKRIGTFLPFGALKHMRNWILAVEYWQSFGEANVRNLLLMLAKNYGGHRKVHFEKPMPKPTMGIYDPASKELYTDTASYLSESPPDGRLPTVGVLLYQGMHFYDTLPILDAFADELKGQANLFPIFSEVTENLDAIRKYFFSGDKPAIDAFVNMQLFGLNNGPFGGPAEPARELLSKLNVPYFVPPKMYYQTIEQWRESETGFKPMDVILSMTLPEMDGAIEPIPSGGPSEETPDSDALAVMVRNRALEERVRRISRRVQNWVSLRKKPNPEKKVAFVLFNYPPGEGNLGNDSYLDIFGSLERILEEMSNQGYGVDGLDDKLHDVFLQKNLINSPKWRSNDDSVFGGIRLTSDRYSEYFGTLPDGAREQLQESWGEPPGGIMVKGKSILIPGMVLGNIFVGLQPSRGIHEDDEKAYHDKDLPPHHQYVAFYKWLQEDFGADAIVHVGTHGTLEFTKGKEAGLSQNCFPDILIGETPHIYIYWVVNASEATIAKRRGYGTLINHRSPTYTTSDLYGELQELSDLLNEHDEASLTDPGRTEMILERIQEVAGSLGMEFDSLESLHATLSKTRRSIIPQGLHIFDRAHEPDTLAMYLCCVLRYDRESKSLHRILAEAKGFDYDALLSDQGGKLLSDHRGKLLSDHGGTHNGESNASVLQEIENQVREISVNLISNPNAVDFSVVPMSLQSDLKETLDFARNLLFDIEASSEMASLIRALDGEYILPGIGGDEIRTTEVYPTGRNSYQFDARMIPSWSAYQRGIKVAEGTLAEYRKRHDGWPRTVSLVLWGFETVKTRGETIGQILHYLGLRPVRKGPYDTSLEVIPVPELGRPRIDVVIEICGIFRDTLPNLVILLDRAAKIAALLDESEESNYVRANRKQIKNNLDPNLDPAERERLSTLRIFGPSASEYASSMRTRIETSNWENEEELADSFIDSMQYAYGEETRAEQAGEVFRGLLSTVDLVSQIRDTHDFEVTDLDHYYEFSGGLTRSVEKVKGARPDTLISDTTLELIETHDIKDAIANGIRTRVLNPKWLDGLLEHDYHGAQKINERVENTLAFAATTHAVDNWVWHKISEKLILDEKMRARLMENNRCATLQIAGRLLEANERGYFDATKEELEAIQRAYVEMEGWVEERT